MSEAPPNDPNQPSRLDVRRRARTVRDPATVDREAAAEQRERALVDLMAAESGTADLGTGSEGLGDSGTRVEADSGLNGQVVATARVLQRHERRAAAFLGAALGMMVSMLVVLVLPRPTAASPGSGSVVVGNEAFSELWLQALTALDAGQPRRAVAIYASMDGAMTDAAPTERQLFWLAQAEALDQAGRRSEAQALRDRAAFLNFRSVSPDALQRAVGKLRTSDAQPETVLAKELLGQAAAPQWLEESSQLRRGTGLPSEQGRAALQLTQSLRRRLPGVSR